MNVAAASSAAARRSNASRPPPANWRQRIAEVEAQDERLAQLQRHLDRAADAVLTATRSAALAQPHTDPRLQQDAA